MNENTQVSSCNNLTITNQIEDKVELNSKKLAGVMKATVSEDMTNLNEKEKLPSSSLICGGDAGGLCKPTINDSDSGRGQTSESSSAGSDNEDTNQQNDRFVDASDVLLDDSSSRGGHNDKNNDPYRLEQEEEDDEYEEVPTISEKQQEFLCDNKAEISHNSTNTNDKELCINLNKTAHILRLALSNEFIMALDMCEPGAKHELYAGLAHATLCFLRAGLTLEQADLQAALVSVQNSMDVSQRMRRQVSTATALVRFLTPYSRATNYNSYTDLQAHAELVNAESLLLHTLISFLADQSVICFVKSAFRIRSCHQRYKECLQMLATRTEWASPEAKCHFESGVRMGNGIFNLLMSYLPRRVLRFLEYAGFSGSRSYGIKELESSIELGDGLRSVLSALVILTYHSYVENLFGIGRYNQMIGNLDEAIKSFQLCIDAQNDWKQFHSICHWEMMWCYAAQMNWLSAAKYANLLRQHSKWSPASYTYQYASFLYAQLLQDLREGKLEQQSEQIYNEKLLEISNLMHSVPSLRIRYAGKTIPCDKFAIERSMKFCRQNNRLALPAMEFLYIWNIFCILKNNPKQVEKIAKFLQEEEKNLINIRQKVSIDENTNKSSGKKFTNDNDNGEEVEEESVNNDDDDDVDDLLLIYLLQGMCQKHLGRVAEAERLFKLVIGNKEKILHKQEKFLIPHAAMELTLLKLDLKQYEEARELIKSTRSDYTGYLLETIVHFRLHAASRVIRLEAETKSENLEEIIHQYDDRSETTSISSPTTNTTTAIATDNKCQTHLVSDTTI